jgi:uncharacterized protein YkwD
VPGNSPGAVLSETVLPVVGFKPTADFLESCMPVPSRMSPLRALKAALMAVLAPGVFISGMSASPAVQASTADVADLVNTLRGVSSKCPRTPGLEKLVRRAELDEAASRMAAGASLRDSAKGSSYQALGLQGISMSGSTDLAALERLLAGGYCPLIVDPRMADIGIHQKGTATWLVLAPSFAPAAGLDEGGLSARLLKLVNKARAQARTCGGKQYPAAGPVSWNPMLASAAREHSNDMARHGFFSHTSRDGMSASDRVERAGYNYRSTAENIAAGHMTPEEVVAGWVASPGHCANLMDASFTEMGAALASNRHSQMGAYWTQVLGVQRAAKARPGPAI